MSEDRVARFLDDILATPDVIEESIDAYSSTNGPLASIPRDLAPPPHRRVVLTGMGSSRFAAQAFLGNRATEIELASARTIAPAADVVLVGISNSGRTLEVVDAIREHHGTSLTIGLTNHPDRPVAAEADIALPLMAGDERSGIASRSYAATLAVLALLLAELRKPGTKDVAAELRTAIAAARALRAGRGAWLTAAADALDGADEIHVIGDGRAMGTLEQAALMLREAPRLRALPMDAGDWLHVGLYTMLPGGRALLFGGTSYDAEIAETVARRGGRVVSVGPPVAGAELTIPMPDLHGPQARAIVAAGVPELIAAELWARAGITPSLPGPRSTVRSSRGRMGSGRST